MQPPTILFVNRVYPPVDGATGQLLAELAPALVRLGHRVTVVTSQTGAGSIRSETVAGVRVVRVGRLPFTRASHWRRALGYLTVYPALLWRALRLPCADVVVTLTDPPLLLVLGVILKVLKGSRHVHWAQDIYPELAEELGVLPKNGMVARALTWVSTAGLRHADRIIAVGRCMKARLVQRGLAPAAIEVIPNWGHGANAECGARSAEWNSELAGDGVTSLTSPRIDQSLLTSSPASGIASRNSILFRTAHGLEDKFVIMYSGNFGLAHPFEAMLDAAERLRSTHPHVLFLFVGDGPRLPWVREQVTQRNLENVRFLPFQPREKLAQSLAAADLHLASMLHKLCGLVVPSKVYGVMSVGRPCVFLGPEESEAAQFILQNGCGSVLAKATGARLASCLAQWAGDTTLLRETRERVEAIAGRVSLGPAVRAFSETLTKVGDSNSSQPIAEVEQEATRLTSPLGTSSTL